MNERSSEGSRSGIKYPRAVFSSQVIPQYMKRHISQTFKKSTFVNVILFLLLRYGEGFCVNSMALLCHPIGKELWVRAAVREGKAQKAGRTWVARPDEVQEFHLNPLLSI